MKKAWPAGAKLQQATNRAISGQPEFSGRTGRSRSTSLNDLVQELHVVRVVDNGLLAVGVFCDELYHFCQTSV